MLIRSNRWDLKASTEDDAVIHFPDGIPALGDVQNFTVSSSDDLDPFVRLTSVEAEGVGFLCISPFELSTDFKVKLNKGNQRKLMAEDADDVVVLAMVTRAGRPEDFTANLLAPLVVNMRNRVAKQIILEKYPVQVNVLDALKSNRSRQEVGSDQC
jgi:flagellar assembly factor FliW